MKDTLGDRFIEQLNRYLKGILAGLGITFADERTQLLDGCSHGCAYMTTTNSAFNSLTISLFCLRMICHVFSSIHAGRKALSQSISNVKPNRTQRVIPFSLKNQHRP